MPEGEARLSSLLDGVAFLKLVWRKGPTWVSLSANKLCAYPLCPAGRLHIQPDPDTRGASAIQPGLKGGRAGRPGVLYPQINHPSLLSFWNYVL
jgi:hypothetical protein